MKTRFFELDNNRYLGLNLFEVYSLPNRNVISSKETEALEKLSKEFEQVLSETHRLLGDNTCLEILWITEDASNQTFRSHIRLYFVLRKIGINKEKIEYSIENTKTSIIAALSSLQFGITDVDYDVVMGLLSKVRSDSVFCVAKNESCVGNANSFYPYYYTDVLPLKNTNSFQSLITAISQSRNCCITFQLFPTSFSSEELYMINEVSGELGRIAAGMMVNHEIYRDDSAVEPMKTYKYYFTHKSSPLFTYNILVFGERSNCANLSAKIISLLQSGTEKISSVDPICLDLSGEGINLTKHFSFYPWNVNTKLIYYYKNQNYLETVPLSKNLRRLQYIVTAEEAVSFFKLPLYEKTMVALRCTQTSQAKEQFSNKVVNENNVQIGELLTNDSAKVVIGCPEKAFTKHMLVVGTPGSGKTNLSINLLLQFANRGIPFLAIEPTKAEYRAMIDAVPGFQIFTPGNNAVSPFLINPFIPPEGIRVEQYVPSLASAFNAAFSMPSPLDMLFIKAIRATYNQYGWKDYSKNGDKDVTVFGLHEFIRVFKKLVEKSGYVGEVKSNIESAGILRLMNLIEQNSNIYDTINTVPISELLSNPTVIELNSIDNAEQKSLIIALLLINICTYTKHNHLNDGKLKNIILIDEAHVLLGEKATPMRGEHSADASGTTIKAIQDMIAEIRSYGTGIIIADQSPTKVSREVVANTDIKVTFRLVQTDEKALIADSTNMDDDEKENLSRLGPGEAYVFYSLLDTPQYVMTEDVREKKGIRLSVSDEEVGRRNTYWLSHQDLLKPYRECSICNCCSAGCDFKLRADAEYIASKAYERFVNDIVSIKRVRTCIYNLPLLMKDEFEHYSAEDRKRVEICSRIKLYRKLLLVKPFELNEKELEFVISQYPEAKEQQ